MAGIRIEGHWYTIANARYLSDCRSYTEQSPTPIPRKLPKLSISELVKFSLIFNQNMNKLVNNGNTSLLVTMRSWTSVSLC